MFIVETIENSNDKGLIINVTVKTKQNKQLFDAYAYMPTDIDHRHAVILKHNKFLK